MGVRFVGFAASALVCLAGGTACAMTSAETGSRCVAVSADKLPAESGGIPALCTAIEVAMNERAPDLGYSIKVTAAVPSRVSVVVSTEDGKTLPEQTMAVMDTRMSKDMLTQFAETVAQEIIDASGR